MNEKMTQEQRLDYLVEEYQERLGVLAAPRMVRSTFLNARLRSAVPQHA